MSEPPPAPTLRKEPRTPAQLWCVAGGWTLLAVGIVGFFVNGSFDTGSRLQGNDLIVFEVNGWHNLVHIASGLLLLSGAGRRRRAKLVALLFGLAYGVVTVDGLVNGDDVFMLFGVDLADNILHIALTLVSLGAALVSPAHSDAELAMGKRLRAHAA